MTYEGIETVTFDKPNNEGTATFTLGVEQKGLEVELNLKDGDQTVNADTGHLLKGLTIKKPESLKPLNIRKGENVCGEDGEFIGDTEEVTVDLTFVSISTEAMLENLSFTSTLDADFGYCHNPESQFDLVIGDTYRVVWGSDEFTCVGMDGSALIAGAILIGNGAPFELTGNGEPFVIGSVGGSLLIACVTDTEPTSHTVSLYHVAESVSDMVIEPSVEDKVLSRVTIEKPDTLIPENIADGVDIGGVKGTLKAGGGSDTGRKPWEPEWIDDICFWDYDGTLILNLPVSEAKNLQELPVPPEHSGLTFQEWNYTLEEVRAAKYPLDIGANYTTTSGATRLVLNVSSASYLAVTLYFSQTVANGVEINWGDGTFGTVDAIGDTKIAHTYASTGVKNVSVKVADGCTMTLGHFNSTLIAFVGGNSSQYRKYLTELHVGERTTVAQYAFAGASSLTAITLPSGSVAEWPGSAITNATAPLLALPRGCTSIASYGLYNLSSQGHKGNIISIPQTVTSIGSDNFSSCTFLYRICIPPQVTAIQNSCIRTCYCAMRVFMSDDVTTLGNYVIYGISSLGTFAFPKSIVTIGDNVLSNTDCEDVIIPENEVTLGGYFLSSSTFNRLIIKGEITAAGTNQFNLSKGRRNILFCRKSPVSSVKALVSNSDVGSYCLSYVPDDAYEECYNAVSSSYRDALRRLSEYPAELP